MTVLNQPLAKERVSEYLLALDTSFRTEPDKWKDYTPEEVIPWIESSFREFMGISNSDLTRKVKETLKESFILFYNALKPEVILELSAKFRPLLDKIGNLLGCSEEIDKRIESLNG